jgi:hypothetical protein
MAHNLETLHIVINKEHTCNVIIIIIIIIIIMMYRLNKLERKRCSVHSRGGYDVTSVRMSGL